MKISIKKYNLIVITFLIALCTSCTKNFPQINQSPDFVSTPNIDFELPYVELTMIDNTYYTMGDYVAPLVGQVTQQKTYINRLK